MNNHAEQRELDLSLLSDEELLSMYHNVEACGCDDCTAQRDALAEEFLK